MEFVECVAIKRPHCMLDAFLAHFSRYFPTKKLLSSLYWCNLRISHYNYRIHVLLTYVMIFRENWSTTRIWNFEDAFDRALELKWSWNWRRMLMNDWKLLEWKNYYQTANVDAFLQKYDRINVSKIDELIKLNWRKKNKNAIMEMKKCDHILFLMSQQVQK